MKRIIAFIIAVIICTAGMCMSIIYIDVKNAGSSEPKSDLHIPAYCLTADVTDRSECAGRDELLLYEYEIYEYDGDGNRIAQYRYDEEGGLKYYRQQRYDKQGNRTEEAYEYSLISGKTENYWQYEYDADGNVIRKTAVAKDGGIPSYSSYYRYEDAGSICVTVYYDGEGEPSGFDSEIRDENGNKLSDYNYDGDGNRRSYSYAKYDEDGRYIYQINGRGETEDSPMKELITEWDDETHTSKETLYEPIGHINAVQYNTYTEDGNQLSGIRYFSGYHGHTESEWNMQLEFTEGYWADYEDGCMQHEIKYAYQEISFYRACRYDGDGNCIEELEYDTDNNTHSARLYRYEYDDEGMLAAKYTYRIIDDLTQPRDDGGTVRIEFDENDYLSCITQSAPDGTVEEQFFFDAEGKIIGQYIPGMGQLWTEELPENDGNEIPKGGDWYVVQKGDSLWKIAEAYYGDGLRCYDLYRENWKTVGPDMNFIPPGMELYIPGMED